MREEALISLGMGKYHLMKKLDIMNIRKFNNDIIISNRKNFDIYKTFESGQCFRWFLQDDGSYIGIVGNDVITVYQHHDKIIFKDLPFDKYYEKINSYFDLDRDYQKINDDISNLYFIGEACNYSNGIRILKQDEWETLISFIISQNNNIPRIKKIISILCQKFGQKIIDNYYTFPTIDELSDITISDLADLRCGFRDKYIMDAINKIKNKEIILNDIYNMDILEARNYLQKIKGVGKKVADCVLLYGFAKMNCFPTDIWIKKILYKFFKDGFPTINEEYLGIVQQYMFYYARSLNLK